MIARVFDWLGARRSAMVWIVACAVVVRLGALIAFRPVFDLGSTNVVHGSGAYDAYAQNLIATGSYGLTPGTPDAVLPPAYGLVLAAFYRIAGRGSVQVVALNTLFDLLTLVALRRIGARLFPSGAIVGTLAAAAVAFYPYLVFQSLTVIDTPLFSALLYVFLALVIDLRDAKTRGATWRFGLSSGVVLGAAVLTRPVLAPFLILLAVWLAMRVGIRSAAARLLPLALAAALVVAPWILRNRALYGMTVGIATNGGSNFWQGNNPDTLRYLRAGYDVQWIVSNVPSPGDPLGPEADRAFFTRGLAYLRSHPEEIPALVWTKFLVYWSIDVAPRRNPSGLPAGDPVAAYSQPLFDRAGRLVHRVYWGSLFFLGIVGIVLTRRSWRDVSLLWLLSLALTAAYVLTHPSTRYRSPGDPGWFLFSSVALVWLAAAGRLPKLGPAACCWIGGARYARPLDPSAARKWQALSGLGVPMHVVGFSVDAWPRHFAQHATFHLLPALPMALLRYLTMFVAGPVLLLWITLRHDVRVIFAQSPFEGAIAAWVVIVCRWFRRDVALVVESHGDFESSLFLYRKTRLDRIYRALMRRAASFALRHAAAGRAVSDLTRRQLATRAPDLDVSVFPAWIDVDAFASAERRILPSASNDVLFAGALIPLKGVHVVIDAFGELSASAPKARLVLAGRATTSDGDEYTAALRAQVARLGLDDRVRFAGEVSTDTLATLMASARVLVLPSLSEGLGRVLVEAMLCGTPVIASRVCGTAEIIHAEGAGYLVEPGDVAGLAGALRQTFADSDIDRMGHRAQDAARRLVSAGAFVDGHRRLLAGLETRRRGA